MKSFCIILQICMSDPVLLVNRTLSMRFHKLAPDNYNRERNFLQGLSQSIRPLGSTGGMMTADRPGIRLDLLPDIIRLLGGFL